MQKPANIVLVGAGKVARALGKRLHETGYRIGAVWSRNKEHAQGLADALDTTGTDELEALPPDADLYLILVPDHAIAPLAEDLFEVIDPSSLVMHSSGATPTSTLAVFARHGVFYPLQSFSPGRDIDFSEVPLCLHTAKAADYEEVETLAKRLSDKVYRVSDQQRLQLHLAAVFVNNFTNYMQHIAQEIVQARDLPGDLLLPLLRETIDKLEELTPAQAQTGPALRADHSTLERHEHQLQAQTHWQELYRLLSQGIQRDLGDR